MSSILDTSSLYSAYGTTMANAKTSNLQSSLSNVASSTEDAELMEACKSFEAYFVQKIIENAKTAVVGEDENEEGEYLQYFGDILNEQYSNLIVENNSTGLAQQLYDSMKTNTSTEK